MSTRRFDHAAGRFRAFFQELDARFVEREEVLQQMALALLGRQHVLMTGPPGTAKSQLAKAVLSRVLDAETAKPSLFERQFSESTVQTDLVGAIDFKTLTETGRTEHFTDEGLIGSVHAFLDEVLDGRDMLLRSTLNLLGEREFKQGKRTVRGEVECAFMTTNRYLAEVLEQSREALLAFVDRIAYLSFIPKGFSSDEPLERVLRARLSTPQGNLHCQLTIQDLDALQETASQVPLGAELCARLSGFFRSFEAEVAAAVRADPEFFPSRYLSTRTKVRAGETLKAAVVYDRIFNNPTRPLEVLPRDFDALRLSLTLAGPPAALLDRSLKDEDPREARQLRIVRTEREVFERCLARTDRRPTADRRERLSGFDEPRLRELATHELFAVAERLARTPGEDRALAELAMRLAVQRVAAEALADSDGDVEPTALRLGEFLAQVERSHGPMSPLASWLRTQLLSRIDAAAARAILPKEWVPLDGPPQRLETLVAEATEQVGRLEALAEQRARLVEVGARAAHDYWQQSIEALTLELAARFQLVLRHETGLVDRERAEALDQFLGSAQCVVRELVPIELRLDAISSVPSRLTARLLEPHSATVAALAAASVSEVERGALLEAVDALLVRLARARFLEHLPGVSLVEAVLANAAQHEEALTMGVGGAILAQRVERGEGEAEVNDTASVSGPAITVQEYRRLRAERPRYPLSYLAAQLYLRLDATLATDFVEQPDLGAIASRVAKLPPTLRQSMAALDLSRVSRALRLIALWWSRVESVPTATERVRAAREGGLLKALQCESVLPRFDLEAELLGAVLPEVSAQVGELRDHIARLQRELLRVHAWVAELACEGPTG